MLELLVGLLMTSGEAEEDPLISEPGVNRPRISMMRASNAPDICSRYPEFGCTAVPFDEMPDQWQDHYRDHSRTGGGAGIN